MGYLSYYPLYLSIIRKYLKKEGNMNLKWVGVFLVIISSLMMGMLIGRNNTPVNKNEISKEQYIELKVIVGDNVLWQLYYYQLIVGDDVIDKKEYDEFKNFVDKYNTHMDNHHNDVEEDEEIDGDVEI
jgi:hypothetical protein